ncbi:pitrilysin family protein [uncultured Methylophaga sp.]|uniref:M16 family metallopeptidase n=1 Tax=uncultured Methylophaga sp. TaxID=285271 RepID=UPI0026098A52|nr:pitrilysin family protein [uncultured Methylophaga sp.]
MFAKPFAFVALCLTSALAWANPDIQHWDTDNGAGVYFVPAPELPMVDISVVFNAGAARDGDMPGLAKMTSAMLDEGAGGMSADEIATAFADVGANFGASSERDMAVFSLRTLTEDQAFEQALTTYSQILAKPDFPQAPFERIQQTLLTGLQAENQSPKAIASRAFYENLYPSHPYGVMPNGTADSVKQLTPEDLKAFYQQYFVSRNAVVVIVGAVDRSEAEQIAERVTAGLAAGEAAPALPQVAELKSAELIHKSFPSTQTTIVMGQPGISRDDPDYFPLYVGNHILGGSGLVSMLSDELREKRGLTYGVYSYFRPMQQLGPYQMALQTRNEKAEEALTVLRDTVKNFVETGPSEAQLTAAKQNITGGFALRVDSNSKIADYLAMIGFYDLPLDYLDNFNDRVNAVTVAEIKDAFKRRVNADKMLTVLVGGETEKQ